MLVIYIALGVLAVVLGVSVGYLIWQHFWGDNDH